MANFYKKIHLPSALLHLLASLRWQASRYARRAPSSIILLTSALFLLTSSCQEGREAGDLLGQWRQTGTDDRYVSFAGSVALFHDGLDCKVFANFQHVGDSLMIQCHSIEGLATDTAHIEQHFGMKPFKDIRLKIDNLDDDHLIVSQGSKTWSFYKY